MVDLRKFAALLLAIVALGSASAEDRLLIEVELRWPGDLRQIVQDGHDVWEVRDGHALLYASLSERERLESDGFEFHVSPLNEKAAVQARGTADGYLTFSEYEAAMQAWAATYPDRVQLFSIGQTWEARPLWMLKISDNVATDEDEPEALLLSLQHAREWLSGMTLHGIARHLIEDYATDAEVRELVDGMEIFVILVANPDGYVYTHTNDRLWRKNRRNNGNGTFGVDLNRNWEFNWNLADSNTASNTYRGPSPVSEPESQALRTWINSRGDDLFACLNYHTYGLLYMHNWAYTTTLPENVEVFGPLAREMALTVKGLGGAAVQGIQYGAWARVLGYTGGGTTIDYFQAGLGLPTLTLELRPDTAGEGGFVVPDTLIAPSVAENTPATMGFLRHFLQIASNEGPPIISNIQTKRESPSSVSIRWETSEPAPLHLDYGLTTSYGQVVAPNLLRHTTHETIVTGLTSNTIYHGRIVAEGLGGRKATSGDFTFSTVSQPSPPVLRSVRAVSPGTVSVEFEWSPTPTVSAHRFYTSSDGGTWTLAREVPAGLDSTVSENFDTEPYTARYFYVAHVAAASSETESIRSDVYGVLPGASDADNVLIVDGFDRWNTLAESDGLNHDFAADHGIAIAEWAVPFDTVANEVIEEGGIGIGDYAAVVWMVGEESTTTETFSSIEQAWVATYLEAAGKLFATGSEIGWDLDRPSGPSAADRAFYNTYLSADFVQDDVGEYDVAGSGSGSLFGSAGFAYDEGIWDIYEVGFPDEFSPLNGASTCLVTTSGRTVGIQRTGVFGLGASDGQLVYLGFPFETVAERDQRTEMMRAVLHYFGLRGGPPTKGVFRAY